MFIQQWEEREARRRRARLEADRVRVQRMIDRPTPTLPPLPTAPGVYREEIAPPGEQWFKIVMPSGTVGIVHFPDELCDSGLQANLWKRFWAKSKRRLKII